MLHILYFAKLRDDLNCGEETLEWQDSFHTIDDIKQHLSARGEPWQSALSGTILTAHNHRMVSAEQTIKDNDELAFFPPVTGG